MILFAAMIIVGTKLGKEFVFVFGTFSVISSNAIFGYEVEIFGFITTWAVFSYCMNFLAVNCLTEFYSKKDAVRYILNMAFVQFLFFVYIMSAGWLEVTRGLEFKSSVEQLYSITPRITLAAMVAHILIFIDASVYKYFKDKEGQGWIGALWFRATLSALVSHLIINVVFFGLAFYGSIPNNILIEIIVANILIKYAISFTETPLMYAARRFMRSNWLDRWKTA